MMLDGTYTGTVDRIVDGQFVVLVEADGETIDERSRPTSELPADAEAGAVCELTFSADELVDIEYRPTETANRREQMRERFDDLSQRLGDDEE